MIIWLLLTETTHALVLLDHQVNSFLGVVKVKLVILGFFLLLSLLVIVLLVVGLSAAPSGVAVEGGAIHSPGLGKTGTGPVKNLLLEQCLLAKTSACRTIINTVKGSTASTLEESL